MSSRDELGYGNASVPEGALFIECDEPLRVFPSARAARIHLEANGVELDPSPAAYGPKGQVYLIRCEGPDVMIERAQEADRPDELKALLLHYLECCEEPEDATETLDCLVAEAWSIERDYWLRNQGGGESASTLFTSWSWVGFMLLVAAIAYLSFR